MAVSAPSSIRWRALHVDGHDVCALHVTGEGARLEGEATFAGEHGAASLCYRVTCDAGWRTAGGRVEGTYGGRAKAFEITRGPDGAWTLNGAPVEATRGCVDLDLGFTPATNLLPIRRLALAVGQAADAPAAWLDVARGTLAVLPQRYQRRSEMAYWYEAPSVGYAALLQVDSRGFVLDYPGLWRAGPSPSL